MNESSFIIASTYITFFPLVKKILGTRKEQFHSHGLRRQVINESIQIGHFLSYATHIKVNSYLYM